MSEQTLESFYAFREIPDPCTRFWKIIEGYPIENRKEAGAVVGNAMTSPM